MAGTRAELAADRVRTTGQGATRRAVIAGLFAASTAACASTRPFPPNPDRPLGLASLTVARELAADYRGTLLSVKAMGYTHFGFQVAGSRTGGGCRTAGPCRKR
jgi:hypothetical protein